MSASQDADNARILGFRVVFWRWVWVNTYRYIFSGMNIHLPAILMFTRGTRFWPIARLIKHTYPQKWVESLRSWRFSHKEKGWGTSYYLHSALKKNLPGILLMCWRLEASHVTTQHCPPPLLDRHSNADAVTTAKPHRQSPFSGTGTPPKSRHLVFHWIFSVPNFDTWMYRSQTRAQTIGAPRHCRNIHLSR